MSSEDNVLFFSAGFIQIIQTSGQQFIAASTPPVQSVIPVQTVTSTCSAVPVGKIFLVFQVYHAVQHVE